MNIIKKIQRKTATKFIEQKITHFSTNTLKATHRFAPFSSHTRNLRSINFIPTKKNTVEITIGAYTHRPVSQEKYLYLKFLGNLVKIDPVKNFNPKYIHPDLIVLIIIAYIYYAMKFCKYMTLYHFV